MTKALWNGEIIAESNECVEVEGNQYFPAESLKKEYFSESETHSVCPWKGTASYYSVTVKGETNTDCAWYYPEPKEEAQKIKGHVAFWRGVEVTE